MRKTNKSELLKRKEIVEWQIKIAKDYKIIALREQELKDIKEQLKQLK